MKSDFQIKVILGFNTTNYKKLMDRIGDSKKIKIGYDIHPYSVSVWNNDISKFRKVDPIHGKITYIGAFLYLEDLIMCAGNSMIERTVAHMRSGMMWDILVDGEIQHTDVTK